MSESLPQQQADADSHARLLSLALDRLEELEAADLAARALTKAEIGKLADDLLALLGDHPGT